MEPIDQKTPFSVFRLQEDGPVGRGSIETACIEDLPAGGLLIRVAYAGVNFKDALGGIGKAPIAKHYPVIGGIEAAGTIASSNAMDWPIGTAVVVHGFGLGVERDGGFSPWIRVPEAFATRIPDGLDLTEAAIQGVAGHTAAYAIELLELNGLKPGRGPVAVSGATGGVGSMAIAMLARLGYEVVALSRKPQREEWLRSLGAASVEAPEVSSQKPLQSSRWAGAVDAVGGPILEYLIRTTMPSGSIAAFGNAAGTEVRTTVLPFILRGVRLLGVNADTRPPLRTRLWQRQASDLKPRLPADYARFLPLRQLPTAIREMVAGVTTGRTLVDFRDTGELSGGTAPSRFS